MQLMKNFLFFLLLAGLAIQPLFSLAQQKNIPPESWRTHFSYQSIYTIAVAGERVYAAGDFGLFYFDREDNSATTVSSIEVLSDAGISGLSYDKEKDILLITYLNGNIDIAENGEVYNISTISDASLPGDRTIHDVQFFGNFVFLATDFGISVLDLKAGGINESYFNLGPEGEATEVYQLETWNDSLFATTDFGFIGNALKGTNLSDYNSWRHFPADALPGSGYMSVLAASPEGFFAGTDGVGLFEYAGGRWVKAPFSTESSFRSVELTKEGLLLSMTNGLFIYHTASGTAVPVSSPLIQSPNEAMPDEAGNLWVADGLNGLLTNREGDFTAVVPNSPLPGVPVSLYSGGGRIVALFNKGSARAGSGEGMEGFSVFSEGQWQNYTPAKFPEMPETDSLSDVVYNPQNQRYYFSSYKSGILEWDPAAGTFRLFNAGTGNTGLLANNFGETPVNAIAADRSGQLWMVQPEATRPLHRYNPFDDTWEAYLEENILAGTAAGILILENGDKWLRLKRKDGGILVFNEEETQSRLLDKNTNSGGLTSPDVTVFEQDLEGQLWVGLEQGVNYFPNPYSALGETDINAAFPVFDGRALLNTQEVTALAIDGGNRKWIGTPSGLWVFGDYGDTLHYHFTDSPLPDNFIHDIAVDQQSGEVFIATKKGMVSFRSGATEAGFEHASEIKVFPNPVYPGFDGKVGITGLARDVVVKITDVSGRLIRELAAEGGTALWDVRDTQGRRPATGVYLIFSSSADGTQTLAGKMAIVN